MRSVYPYYYPWRDEQFAALWKDALFVFVFDANALLNIYTFSEKVRDQIIDLISRLKPNIWLPYQFGLEYQKNRIKVIKKGLKQLTEAKKSLLESKTMTNDAVGGFNNPPNRFLMHDVFAPLEELFDKQMELVSHAHRRQEALLRDDSYHTKLTSLFEGHVGPSTSTDELHALFDKAQKRFSHFIPPGFEDTDKIKDKLHPYGDYLGWHQLVEHAKSLKRPVILVSDDQKPDWWTRESIASARRPRPELRTEFHDAVGQEFFMYRLHQFIQEAQKHGKLGVPAEALTEAKVNEQRDLEAHPEDALDADGPKKKTVPEKEASEKKVEAPELPKKVPASEGKKVKPPGPPELG
jgi:hypothetical protein